MLLVLDGLPATGKTTVARTPAAQLCAAYVRIDTIETAIGRAEGEAQWTSGRQLLPGYEVGHEVAADQLRINLDVAAASVNPIPAVRHAWRAAVETPE